MENKDVITTWFIGSNACGKTTQAKLLHKAFQSKEKIVIKTPEFKITDFGLICNLGVVNDNQCSGADTLSGMNQFVRSYEEALDTEAGLIVVDAIMATGQFLNFLKNKKSYLLTVLLDFEDVHQNVTRVILRRQKKRPGKVIQFNGKTLENLQRKIQVFRNLYRKAEVVSDYAIKINAERPMMEIHNEVLKAIGRIGK